MLPKLCELYIQDFDLIFQEPTGPIDMFCQQHDLEDQEALLSELKMFHQEALSGTKSSTCRALTTIPGPGFLL